jgi:hypothetical protein
MDVSNKLYKHRFILIANYGNGVLDVVDEEIKKALLTISIRQALLEIGKPVLGEIERALYSNYKCYVPDCLDHPEYLKQILQDLYGNASLKVIESIHKHLDEYDDIKPIKEFLTIITK